MVFYIRRPNDAGGDQAFPCGRRRKGSSLRSNRAGCGLDARADPGICRRHGLGCEVRIDTLREGAMRVVRWVLVAPGAILAGIVGSLTGGIAGSFFAS